MVNKLILCMFVFVCFAAAGCNSTHEVAVKPVEIKPIHITIDVNVRVQKSLNDVLDEIGE